MKKGFVVAGCCVLLLFLLFNPALSMSIKRKVGVGLQCLPNVYYYYDPYSYPYYYYPYSSPWIEIMSGVTDELGIIISVSKVAESFLLKGGVQHFVDVKKNVSPYVKFDVDYIDTDGSPLTSYNLSIGFQYFHNEHLSAALHTPVVRHMRIGGSNNTDISMFPGLYVWFFF